MRNVIKRLVASLVVVATIGAGPPAVPPVAKTGTDVTRATLANGLRVVIVRDPLAPVATVYDNYLVGARDTPEGFPGMAHAQEHMAFRGCHGVTADQTSAVFAQLGGEGDADTQDTITQYFSTVPASDLDVALNVDSSCMRDIQDSDTEWKSERGAIEQEVARDLSNPTYNAIDRIREQMFAGTPYAHDALGTRASFDKTTGPMLKDFYSSWYAPNNAILVIAGDVDPQATLATVRSLYESIPSRTLPKRAPIALQPVRADAFSLESDLPYSLQLIAYRLPGTADPDYAAMRVLSDVLSNQRGDLYTLVATGKALQADFELAATTPEASIGFAVGVVPAGADTKALDAALASTLAAYVKGGVPADLVDAAKRSEIASGEFDRNSISGLAELWSDTLANEGRNAPRDDLDAVAKVSVADVNRVAAKYLLPSAAITATLVPKPSGKSVASKGFGGGETLTSAPTKAVVLPDFAKKLENVTVANSTLAPTDTTLPNGLRVIVQPETISDTVTLTGSIRHRDDLQTPKGRDGVSSVLDGLFSYGTTSLDRIAYQKALDDIAASASAGTTFGLSVLKANFERGVALLADDELHPALPDQAFGVVRAQTAQELAGQMRSPGYLAGRATERGLLPAGDPALREATPASVSALTPNDVRSFYGSVYRPDMTTIVVIGNVAPKEANDMVAKYFGGWTASGPKPKIDLARIPQNKPSVTIVPNRSRVQDDVSLVETSPVVRDDPDYYALEVGDHVLGGGFYATRLYRDLRQIAGLVYNVDNHLSAGKTRSTYSVTYGCDPPNVSKARALVERDLRAMRDTLVSDGDLQQAKAILLRQLPLGEASEESVAAALARYATSDLPLDESHRAAEKFAGVTAAQIRAAFAKNIRPDGFVQVVQGPDPS